MISGPPHLGPIRLTDTSRVAFQPATSASVTGGFWAERRQMNRDVTVPSTWHRLHQAGNIANLEVAAGRKSASYVDAVAFFDSDVYKWLEAVGWTLADPLLAEQTAALLDNYVAQTCTLLSEAQADDGYLNSYFQVVLPGKRFADLQWGHELYCAGHLIQGAIALHRGSGDSRLLSVARSFADLIVHSFGPLEDQIDGIDGHPEIESALVELYRETGEPSYLDTARYFLDRRGHGLLGPGQFGSQYWQDHIPVRDATAVAGHAVRQLYLLAAVADAYTEIGDTSLLEAAERLWREMVSTRTYLTGGVGTHHRDEAFGDPYELTNERSYCETCAAIASVMFSWRMLLITGEARYADLIERTLFNGVISGVSLDGQSYVYANPLHIREGHLHQGNQHDYVRQPWFGCACCPPNVMRTLASLEHYAVICSPDEVRVHQYMSGRFSAAAPGGGVTLEVDTDYPWDGRVRVLVADAPGGRWALTVRMPQWAPDATVELNGERHDAGAANGWLGIQRNWLPGDELVLDLPLTPRFTRADPRVDADRGLVAVERGPLVYCVESADQPGQRLDDIVIDPGSQPMIGEPVAGLGSITTLNLTAEKRRHESTSWWPYTADGWSPGSPAGRGTVTAIPYFAWGNREPGAMRVWLRTQ
jgi:uncharacterized protein